MRAAPSGARIALTNHRHEVLLIDVDADTCKVIDHSECGRSESVAWSPDGAWLYFVADPDGVSDLYRVRIAGGTPGTTERLTRLTTGVSGFTELSPALSVAARTGEVAFSVFRDFRYEIHTLREGAGELPVPPAVPARRAATSTGATERFATSMPRPTSPSRCRR